MFFTLCSIFLKMFLSFVWASFSHSSCILYASSFTLVHIFFFFFLLPLDSFVYSWQKRRKYIIEYTGVFCHFYMTYVHILKGRNSTLCTFVRGEIHRGDAYIKGEKTFFYEKTLFYLMLVFSMFYGALCSMPICLEHFTLVPW